MIWPKVTSITVILSFCLVRGDSRRKPYSSEYSTIYFSSGQTVMITYIEDTKINSFAINNQ